MPNIAALDPQIKRIEFLESMIGLPWKANAKGPNEFDCWHCACYVQYHLFGRRTPNIEVPSDPSWSWIVGQFAVHEELNNWVERLIVSTLVDAEDGSMVLMSRSKSPAHIGVWLRPERAILHCDQDLGVAFQTVDTLQLNGWKKLKFYEPRA